MSYSGRKVMSQVAAANGWTETLVAAHEYDAVSYEDQFGAQAVIFWTVDNSAASVLLARRGEGELSAVRGACALVDVRHYIEANPVSRSVEVGESMPEISIAEANAEVAAMAADRDAV